MGLTSDIQATAVANFGGGKAAKKARVMADSILARTRAVYKKMGRDILGQHCGTNAFSRNSGL